jgi:hypothetical protein
MARKIGVAIFTPKHDSYVNQSPWCDPDGDVCLEWKFQIEAENSLVCWCSTAVLNSNGRIIICTDGRIVIISLYTC